MNQQGINLSGRSIFFENIEIVQNLFIAIELVQDLTKLVLSLFSLVIFEFPRGSLGLTTNPSPYLLGLRVAYN